MFFLFLSCNLFADKKTKLRAFSEDYLKYSHIGEDGKTELWMTGEELGYFTVGNSKYTRQIILNSIKPYPGIEGVQRLVVNIKEEDLFNLINNTNKWHYFLELFKEEQVSPNLSSPKETVAVGIIAVLKNNNKDKGFKDNEQETKYVIIHCPDCENKELMNKVKNDFLQGYPNIGFFTELPFETIN